MKPIGIIIAVILAVLIVFIGYNYLNQPQPMSERLDNAAGALGNGNLGEALDEAGNETRGDKITDDLNDAGNALTASPTTAQ
jgi:hypothetical protein